MPDMPIPTDDIFFESSIAEIDLGAILANLAVVRQYAGGKAVCAVVKSNAYGHGLCETARALAAGGADWLAVATVQEGLLLRETGIDTPILVLRYIGDADLATLIDAKITPVVYDLDQFVALADAIGNRRLGFHLKVDTGMARMGIRDHEVSGFLKLLRQASHLKLDGVMTHFANADVRDHETNVLQLQRFRGVLETINNAGFKPRWIHAANSAATLTEPLSHFNMVRTGLALYGLDPLGPATGTGLRPAMRWITRPIQIKHIDEGVSVSYGWRWTAKRPSVVATLPVGYADGYRRNMSGQAEVLIKGRRAPVIGSICMDFCLVDVTEIEDISKTDEVTLIGRQGDDEISAYALASWSGSIPYEIVCLVSDRVRRVYRS